MTSDDLLVLLGDRPARGVQRWLHEGLRAAIRGGRLPAGQRLPSSRLLAAALQVARGTVTGALDLLVAEGFRDVGAAIEAGDRGRRRVGGGRIGGAGRRAGEPGDT